MFEVNHEFKSKTSKVKILSISTKREIDQERDVTKNQILDDRKPQIEAAIIV